MALSAEEIERVVREVMRRLATEPENVPPASDIARSLTELAAKK